MNTINNLYGAFSVEYEAAGEKLLLIIIPEMAPAKVDIKPLGSYFIYCIHPERGSMTFIIEQDERLAWYSDKLPPFIDAELIAWIGKQIEGHK